MEIRAVSKYLRISPSKARPVVDLARNKPVDQALTLLQFTPQKGARLVSKTLRSAVANADQSEEMDMESLFIKSIYVDEGPRLKRWQPRSMGRANRIIKRTRHITVVLAEK